MDYETALRAASAPVSAKAGVNIKSLALSLNQFGAKVGLDQPHRFVQFGAQTGHESGRYVYDRELWGPTAAQKRYERDFTKPWTKDDPRNKLAFQLGNSEKGDGKKFSGKGPIQLTGRGNVTRFYNWAKAEGFNPPNFVEDPDLINTDPWEGLAAIWYWSKGNPTGKSLNALADANNIEMITKRVNGGLNGYEDRLATYTKLGLAVLGWSFDDKGLRAFQTAAKQRWGYDGEIDGDDGPKTRAAIHRGLVALGTVPETQTSAGPVVKEVKVPVEVPVEVKVPVEVPVPVPTPPKGSDKTLMQRIAAFFAIFAPLGGWLAQRFANLDQTGVLILLGIGTVAVVVLFLRGEMIAQRAKAILDVFDA